jgi:hypothetical protein
LLAPGSAHANTMRARIADLDDWADIPISRARSASGQTDLHSGRTRMRHADRADEFVRDRGSRCAGYR